MRGGRGEKGGELLGWRGNERRRRID